MIEFDSEKFLSAIVLDEHKNVYEKMSKGQRRLVRFAFHYGVATQKEQEQEQEQANMKKISPFVYYCHHIQAFRSVFGNGKMSSDFQSEWLDSKEKFTPCECEMQGEEE